MWNVHRMFITYIHRTQESRNTKNTYDFLVQVRNFLLPLSLKVFWHKERDTIFLCWLFHLPQTTCALATMPRRASESQPSSSDGKTQLTDFSQISAHASGAWRHSHPPTWDFYCDICEWHILPACACEHQHSCLHQTNLCTEPKGSQPN